MTTIVYSHKEKVIACDSRATADGTIITDKLSKVHVSNGLTYLFAGKPADKELLVLLYEEGARSDEVPEIEAIVIDEGEAYHIYPENGGVGRLKLEFDFAIGSGGYWALSALDFGKDARGAVKYACTRDAFSGGKVNVIRL